MVRTISKKRKMADSILPSYMELLDSQSPLGFRAGDVDLYEFVDNQPIDYIDPSGLKKTPQIPEPPFCDVNLQPPSSIDSDCASNICGDKDSIPWAPWPQEKQSGPPIETAPPPRPGNPIQAPPAPPAVNPGNWVDTVSPLNTEVADYDHSIIPPPIEIAPPPRVKPPGRE
jgi:hypothetical protein